MGISCIFLLFAFTSLCLLIYQDMLWLAATAWGHSRCGGSVTPSASLANVLSPSDPFLFLKLTSRHSCSPFPFPFLTLDQGLELGR